MDSFGRGRTMAPVWGVPCPELRVGGGEEGVAESGGIQWASEEKGLDPRKCGVCTIVGLNNTVHGI